MDKIKSKIVKAEAKGDTKQVEKLKRQLAALRDKSIQIKAHIVASNRGIRIGDTRISMRAYRSGGRPQVGVPAIFHRDEIWVPDHAGTVISQARSRAMLGSAGPLAGGGGVVLNVQVSGDTDPNEAGRRIARILGRYLKGGGKLNGVRIGT